MPAKKPAKPAPAESTALLVGLGPAAPALRRLAARRAERTGENPDRIGAAIVRELILDADRAAGPAR
jgi:hypothetical protein